MAGLDERLNLIENKISEKSFRENKGLGNEVGYYIFDYDPREELFVRNHIQYLKDKINNSNKGFEIIEFDLFHLMIEILEEEGYLESFFELEKENGFFETAENMVETLGLDETNELNLILGKVLENENPEPPFQVKHQKLKHNRAFSGFFQFRFDAVKPKLSLCVSISAFNRISNAGRLIDREVVSFFVGEKLIYESKEPSADGSKEYHNAIFVGYDENGVPRHAHKRGLACCFT